MKDIMTAEEYHDNLEIYFTQISNHTITEVENDLISFIHSACEAYAKYYAQALIESLTPDEINDHLDVAERISKDVDRLIGAKWLREELLKRNEGH